MAASERETAATTGESETHDRELSLRLKLLLDTTSHLIETLQTKELLPSLLDLSRKVVAADAFCVWRMDEADMWSVVSSSGLSEQFIQETIHSGRPVDLPAEPVVVHPDDIADRSTELLRNRWDRYAREGIQALMILPLRIHGELSGTLVFYCHSPHCFSDIEVESARALANIASAAITTAELYESQTQLRRDAEEAAVREAFLAEAGAILSESLDYEKTLANVARAAVPEFADWCAADLLDAEGKLQRLAVAHIDPEKVELARQLHEKYPPEDRLELGPLHVIRTGVPEMMNDIPDELLVKGARDEEHLRILRELQLTSYICVPLRIQESVCGVLLFVITGAKRRYEKSDLVIAQEIARRAAQAIQNARLYKALHEREKQYELVIAGAEAAIWDWDVVNKRVDFSPRWKELRGLSDDDVTDSEEEWINGIHPQDVDRVIAAVRDHFEGRTSCFCEEYRVRHKDGRWIWILDRGLALRDSSGRVLRMAGSETNITERKHAEKRVRQHAHALEIINGVNLSLAAEVELEKIVQIATDAGTALTSAEFGAFFYNRTGADGERYMLYALSGADREAFEGFSMPRATDLFGPTFCGERPIRSDDITADPRFGRMPPHHGMPPGHLPVRSYLAAPVISRTGEIHGGLFFGHSSPAIFTAQHEQIITGIAAQTAIAIDNARLYDEVRESERRYRQVVQGVPVAVYTTDAEGRITLYNDAAAEMWGRRPVIGKDQWCGSWQIFEPDGTPVPLDQCPMARTLSEARSVRQEVVVERPDGVRRHILPYPEPLTDAGGKLVGAVNVLVDITDRKRAEEALRESEQRFRLMADAAPVLIWISATDKLCTWFNKSWLEFTGRAMEQELGNGWLQNVHPDDRDRCARTYLSAFDARRPFTAEYRMRRHDGEYRWMLNNGVPRYGSDDAFTGFIGSCIDITDHKRAEQALRRTRDDLERRVAERTAELEQQNYALRRLANQLTETEQRERRKLALTLHDGLQQILVAGKMQLSSIAESGSTRAIERVQALLNEAIKTSRSLSYELSPPALHTSDLPQAVRWLSGWFRTNYDFDVDLQVDEAFPALPDNTKVFLFNVIRELLFNSVKHSGGKSAAVELSCTSSGELCIAVADNGRGFEIDGAGTEPHVDPHGLGLFSIRERLVALGGSLKMESSPGEGARFILTLPSSDRQGSMSSFAAARPDGSATASRDGHSKSTHA